MSNLNKTEHSPGPWVFYDNRRDPNFDYSPGTDGTFRVTNFKSNLDVAKVRTEADAHLVAAAPSLLDALRAFVGLKPAGYCSHGVECFHCAERRKNAEAAIAKASGGKHV